MQTVSGIWCKMSNPTAVVVVPGQRLGNADAFASGLGTFVRAGKIYASIVGVRKILANDTQTPTIQVTAIGERSSVIPEVGFIVTCQVTAVNPRFAKVDIICVGSAPLKENFRGMIRVQDVRDTEKDKVEIYKSFRPGDVVLARVISLGDARSYLLSTAANELGVVHAESEDGHRLIPINWTEMQCEKSLVKEFRKVARVQKL